MTGESLRKIIQQLLLMCYMLKKRIYIVPTFENKTEIKKSKSLL